MNRALPLRVPLLLLAFFAVRPATGDAAEAARLHVILVCDTQAANIGAGMRVNREAIGEIISEVFADRPHRLGTYMSATEDQLNPEAILQAIAALQVDAGRDSILFYYCGHGGWDAAQFPSGDERGHFLALSGGTLERYRLRNALAAKGAFGVFLITDCCSNIAGIAPPARNVPAKWEAFQDLFFRHGGIIDIQAAWRTEFGWCDNGQGGLFTRTLTRLLCESRDVLRPDGEDGFVSWSDFYPRLKSDTLSLFRQTQQNAAPRSDGEPDIRDFEAQTPQDFYLAEWPRHARFVHVRNRTGEPLRLCVQYYHYTDGGWKWEGTPGTEDVREATLPTGYEGELVDGGNQPVRAHKIIMWASTPGGRTFGRTEWTLVPDGGYRPVNGDDGVSPLTFE